MKRFLLFLTILSLAKEVEAQNVGIGTSSPAASAQLDISSTTKGLLIPRMNKTQRLAISSPASGLLVFQTGPDSTGIYYASGSLWKWLDPNAGSEQTVWKVNGNSGTTVTTDFIGTTDPESLAFRVNNLAAGKIDYNDIGGNTYLGVGNRSSGSKNTAIGFEALPNTSSTGNNVVIGFRAMKATLQGYRNVVLGDSAALNWMGDALIAIGHKAAYQSNAAYGSFIAIGDSALYSNTTGSRNYAFGLSALAKNVTGGNNFAFGNKTLYNNTSGFFNIGFGNQTLYSNTTGSYNVAIGDSALAKNLTGENNLAIGFRTLARTTGFSQTAIGYKVLSLTTSGSDNTGVGAFVMWENTIGSNNTALGTFALASNISGSDNTAVGKSALYDNEIGSSNTAIGDSVLSNNFGNVDSSAVVGSRAFRKVSGDNNTGLGAYAGYKISSGNGNTFIGQRAGYYVNNGSGNVIIGANAGPDINSTGNIDNKLYIDNTPDNSPLVYGDFNTDLLRINGTLNINSSYSFPTTPGATGQVLRYGGGGSVTWASNGAESASNGVTLIGTDLRIGGSLSSNSQISFGNNSLHFALTSTGGFYASKTPSGDTSFALKSDGNLGLGTTVPVTNLDVNGDVAHRQNIIEVVNGVNNNVDPGKFSFIKVTGPTAAFSITGFSSGVDGKILTVVNLTGQDMTIVNHLGGGSALPNRIVTMTGADITTIGVGTVTMQYSAADNRWMIIAVRD